MCLDGRALHGKVSSQIHIDVRQLLKAVAGCLKRRVLAAQYPPTVNLVLDAGEFAIFMLTTFNKATQSARYGIKHRNKRRLIDKLKSQRILKGGLQHWLFQNNVI